MAIKTQLLRVLDVGRRQGLGRSVRTAELIIASHWMSRDDRHWDAMQQVETAIELETGTEEAADASDNHRYTGAPVALLRAMFSALHIEAARYTLIDYGSGKGRVLMVGAEHGFGEAIGIEYCAELHERATQNIERWRKAHRGTKCRIELIHGDARTFAIPHRPVVLFFNNPFGTDIMRVVVERIREAFTASPGPNYVIYMQLHPELEDDPTHNLALLTSQPFLKPCEWRFPRWSDRVLARSFSLSLLENSPVPARTS